MSVASLVQCTVFAPEKIDAIPLAVASQNAVQADARLTWTDGEYAVFRGRDDKPHVVILDPPALGGRAAA